MCSWTIVGPVSKVIFLLLLQIHPIINSVPVLIGLDTLSFYCNTYLLLLCFCCLISLKIGGDVMADTTNSQIFLIIKIADFSLHMLLSLWHLCCCNYTIKVFIHDQNGQLGLKNSPKIASFAMLSSIINSSIVNIMMLRTQKQLCCMCCKKGLE